MWKWLLGMLVIVVAAVGVGGYFITKSPAFEQAMKQMSGKGKTTEVRLEEVGKGNLIRTVAAPGTVESRTSVKVSAQVSAKIMALPFRAGEDVKKGDTIVRLDARDLQASLESAQAQRKSEEARLEGAKAALERAKQDLDRQKALIETRDVAPQVLEAAEAAYRQAQSQYNSAEQGIEITKANIRRAERDLENSTITAPMDGTITALNMEVGEQVLGTFNNAGSVIMEIADLQTMIVKARVDESMVSPVRSGQHAKVYVNMYSERTFDGEVGLVGLKNLTDKDGTRYVEVEIALKLKEGERLRTGLTANTDIEVETLYDVAKAPSQAVVDRRLDDLPKEISDSPLIDRNRPFARVVFKLIDGKAKAFPVTVGPSDLTQTVITAGINPGDRIIAGPFKALVDLKDGKEVVEQGTQPAPNGKEAPVAGEKSKADKGGSGEKKG